MEAPEALRHTIPALSVTNLHAGYGAHVVLRGVTAQFHSGRIVAIVGGNGAGKSTLIKIIAGVQRASVGEMRVDGRVFDPRGPEDARRLGIATLYQEGSLIEDWPVFEHFRRVERGLAMADESNTVDCASAALHTLGVHMDVRTRVRHTTPFQRQMIEIARIRARRARVFLLDEPTAGLDQPTREALLGTIRGMCNTGCSVVLVSHDLPAVVRHADDILVLRDGAILPTQRVEKWSVEKLRRCLGDPSAELAPAHRRPLRASSSSTVVLEYAWRTVDGDDRLLSVRRGEVVGIRGDIRSNASSLLRAMLGIGGPNGRLSILGKPTESAIESCLAMGIRYVSRERQTEWSFEHRTVRENLLLGILASKPPFSMVRCSVETRLADELCRRFNVQVESLDQDIQSLSGGNLQKVALARAAATRPTVLLVDEPFSGVDSAARALLVGEIRALASGGTSVIAYSQENDPLEQVCDRIVDLSEGRLELETSENS